MPARGQSREFVVKTCGFLGFARPFMRSVERLLCRRPNGGFGHTPAARFRILQMAASWTKAAVQLLRNVPAQQTALGQEQKFGCRELSKKLRHLVAIRPLRPTRAQGVRELGGYRCRILGGRRQLPAVRAYRRDHASAVGGQAEGIRTGRRGRLMTQAV